jgi:hypothetical protein
MSMYHAPRKRYAYKIIVGKPGGDQEIDETIILKQAIEKVLIA